MEFISVFNDVLGPIMRGPSSSHTAGGYRIGRLVRDLLADEPAWVRVTFDPAGSMAPTYQPLGVDLAFISGIMGWSMLDDRYHAARERAGRQEVAVSFEIAPLEHAEHPNAMQIEAESAGGRRLRTVAEAVGGGGVRITRVGGWQVELDGKSGQVLVEIDAEGDTEVVELLSDPSRQISEGSALLTSRTAAPSVSETVSELREVAGVKDVWSVSPVFFVRRGATLFTSAEEMVTTAEEKGLSLGEIGLAYEVELLAMTETEAIDEMLRRYRVMKDSIDAGFDDARSDMLLLQPTASKVFEAEKDGKAAIGGIHTRAAARAMADSGWRSVVVADPHGKPLGVFSGLDLLCYTDCEEVPDSVLVTEVMHAPLFINMDASLQEAAKMMIDNHHHRVLVIDPAHEDSLPLGVISSFDIVSEMARPEASSPARLIR